MNFFNDIIPEKAVTAFGWMIVHSIWEGALVALILAVILLMLNKKSARIRYLVSVGAFLFFAAISIRTFVEYYNVPINISSQKTINQESIDQTQITNNSTTNNTITNNSFINQVSQGFTHYFNQHIPLIVTIYFLGVLFLTLKLTGGFLYSQRIKNYKTKNVDDKLNRMLREVSGKLNIKQKVKLVESVFVNVPVTLGYVKPVILFPIGTLTGLSYSQVEAILAHELAHIKRADYLINLIQSLLEVVFFYHPAVWWISAVIREERENVCDDIALEVCEQPGELARALVYVGQFESSQTSFAMSAIGNKNKLIRRVKRMMGENKHNTVRSRVYAASLMLLITLAFGAIACSTANGETYKQSREENLVYEEDRYGDHRYINTDRLNEDERTYIFYKRLDGEKSKWEVTVDNGKITSLYKDGNPVAQNEIPKYEERLLDEIDYIDRGLEDLDEELVDLKDDLKNIKIDLGEDFAEDMRKLTEDLKVEFNSDEFKYEMKQLKKELKNLNIEKFHFDSDEFRKEMSELRDELRDIEFDIDIDWDSDEFRREMKDLSRELASIKVDVDLSGLKESMRELKDEMEHLDIDMSELRKEMEILGDFLDELREEMIADGVIDDEDEFRHLEFEDDAMYLNGEKIPDELYNKYKKIYKKYYGEYPDDDSFQIRDRW